MKHQIKTRCCSCICFCSYRRKKHLKHSISTRRGSKFIPHVISKTLSRTRAVSRTGSERSSSDERFSCHDVNKPEPSYQIVVDKEEEQYTVSELEGEASESSDECHNVKICRIGDSETTAIAAIPSSSDSEISIEKSYTDAIPTNRDSEISYESYRDEIPKTGYRSYRNKIPMGTRGGETKCQKFCRHVILNIRDSKISHNSHTDERPRHGESKPGHKISKIVFADDMAAKQNMMSKHDAKASEIRLHEGYSLEIPRSRDSETSSQKSSSDDIRTSCQKSRSDEIPTSRDSEISHKSYRDEKPRRRESKTSHKISKIVVADDKVVNQFTMSQHDGETSEIGQHESYSVEIPRRIESVTSSEKSCRDGTPNRREPEISHKSYRYEKPRQTESICSNEISKIGIANAKGVKQYTTNEHNGETSEISLHQSHRVEIPRNRDSETRCENSYRDGIPTIKDSEISDKSYRDNKPSRTVSKTSHKRSEIVVAGDNEVKQYTVSERGGEASETILHESYDLEIPKRRDSETSSQNSCRDGISTSTDFEISHTSYGDEKPRYRESKTSHKISKLVVADNKVIKQYTMSDHDGEASENTLHESYRVEIPRSRDSDTGSQNSCRDGIPTSRDSAINHESYKDEKPRQIESKTSHKICKIVVPDDKEVKQYTLSERGGEASETNLHESYIIEIPRSRDSETSSQNSCSDRISTSRYSGITHKSFKDERPRRKQSKTSQKISKIVVADDKVVKQYTLSEHEGEASDISLHEGCSVEIHRSIDSETSSQDSCGDGIPTSRECEINRKSYRDEKPRHRQSKTSHEISKIVVADDEKIKQYTTSEHNGDASEISVHGRYSVKIPRSIDFETSNQKIYRDVIPTSRDSESSHKSYRDEKLRHLEYKTSHKIKEIVVADDKEVEQYRGSEHDGDASEMSLHENYNVGIPRSIDSDTINWRSCRDETATSRDSEIIHKSYRDKKSRCRDSKTGHKTRKIVDVDDKVLKQYSMSEHDGEASEISLHESYSVEIPRSRDSETSSQCSCRYGIPTSRGSEISHKSYGDEKLSDKESKTSHKISKIVVADDKEVKQYSVSEHDVEASEISLHKSFSVETTVSRSRDSDTSSQKSVRDGIPTSRDLKISHKSFRDEKPKHRESKTSIQSYKIEIPMPIKDGETSRQKSSGRGVKTIHRSSENWQKNRGRYELSIRRFAEMIRGKFKDETPQRNFEISQACYRDKKLFKIKQQCRDETTSTYDNCPFTINEFEDLRDKSIIVEPFYESEDYAEIIRQLIRQFFAEGGLHAAEVLEIDNGDSISQINYPENVHKLVQRDDDGTNCHYCTVKEVHGRGCEQ